MKLIDELEKRFRIINEDTDRISDKEANTSFDDLDDRDIDNDGDVDDTDSYLHKRLGTIAKMDEEEEADLEEMNTTASAGGEYQTPYAFGKKEDEKDNAEVVGYKKVRESIYKKMMRDIYGVNEAVSYRDYKKDPKTSPQQKVNHGIAEVNKMLAEMERIVSNNLRLKQEMGVDSSHFWKSTGNRFAKINERMTRISNRLRELSK